MAVAALVDPPAAALLEALQAVRDQPAPLGQVPARLTVLARASAELVGTYLRDLDEAERAGEHTAAGCRSVADLLVDAAGLPPSRARADAALARRLGGLPGLLDAVAEGGVELAAGRHLARAWSALPERLRDRPTAAALISLGGLVDLADLKAKVDELVAALQPEITDDALANAYEERELSLVDVGAETRVDGHGDALEGEWLREVLQAKAERDRVEGDGRTGGARLWDALLDCVRAAVSVPGAVPCPEDVAPTLVVVASVEDVAASAADEQEEPEPEQALAALLAPVREGDLQPARGHRGAHSRGGVPLGPRALARVCCEAVRTQLRLDAAGLPLDSSPLSRQLNRRERRALEHRAAYRCQRLGCGRSASACVPHHVLPFALGGPTLLSNMVLLCRSCHHLLHDRQRELELVDGSRIGSRGWVRPPPPTAAVLF